MQILVKILLIIIAGIMVSGAGKKRFECKPGFREASKGPSWIVCDVDKSRTIINTTPSDIILVAKLPDVPELTDTKGNHFDLGFSYRWRIERANGKTIPGSEKGHFVGYIGSKNSYIRLCQGDLDRIMEIVEWDKLPELPGRLRIAEVLPLKSGYRHRRKRPALSSSKAEKIAYQKAVRRGCTSQPSFVPAEPDPALTVIQKLKIWWQNG